MSVTDNHPLSSHAFTLGICEENVGWIPEKDKNIDCCYYTPNPNPPKGFTVWVQTRTAYKIRHLYCWFYLLNVKTCYVKTAKKLQMSCKFAKCWKHLGLYCLCQILSYVLGLRYRDVSVQNPAEILEQSLQRQLATFPSSFEVRQGQVPINSEESHVSEHSQLLRGMQTHPHLWSALKIESRFPQTCSFWTWSAIHLGKNRYRKQFSVWASICLETSLSLFNGLNVLKANQRDVPSSHNLARCFPPDAL